MIQSFNQLLLNEATKKFNIKNGNFFTNATPNFLTPVIEIREKGFTKTAGSTGSGAVTVYTTPTDKDFYICSGYYSISKDATCDSASGPISITYVQDGQTMILLQVPIITLTAQTLTTTTCFPYPIKCDRGTNISMVGTFTAGAMTRVSGVSGFISETLSN